MYACLFLYCMYILYKHTGPDTCHIHRTWQSKKKTKKQKNICPGVQIQKSENKIKNKVEQNSLLTI